MHALFTTGCRVRTKRSLWTTLTFALAAFLLAILGAVALASPAGAATIMVIAPHPDDDLLYGAGITGAGHDRGDTVKVVYMTNGDLAGVPTGYQRQDEAVAGQFKLYNGSVPSTAEDQLIFLGYSDGSLGELFNDYPNVSDIMPGDNGASQTYGARGLGRSDYHIYKFGSHANYNGANVLADLDAILAAYKPDKIYTTSAFDVHGDHATTNKFVRLALANRKAADPTYNPTLYQTIVWTEDSATWPTALSPTTSFTEPPGLPSGLPWSSRSSITVPSDMQSTWSWQNRKIQAIDQHASEGGSSGFLGRFVHKDEFFWTEPLTAPTGTMTIDAGNQYATTTAVTLTFSVSGATSMHFRNGTTGVFSAWEPYADSSGWSLLTGEGVKTVQAEFRSSTGSVLSGVSDTITLDTTAPTGTMAIDGGAQYATVTAVTVNNSISDAAPIEMRFSNDGSSWSTWEAYASTKTWTLPSGDGLKTVQAQYRDATLHVLSVSDAITLDMTSPSGTMAINSGAVYTNALAITLNNSVSGATQMRFQDGGGSWSDWETYAVTKAWSLPTGDGLKTVNAEYRDAAGNVLAASDAITLDMTPPSGDMVINNDAAWSNVLGVTLNNSVSGATEMHFQDDGGVWGSWEPYALTKAWTLPAGDGPKTVNAEYRDAAGNVLGGVSDSITLDMTPPSGDMVINNDAVWATTRDITLNNSVSGATQMRFQDGGGSWSGWETYAAAKAWNLPAGDGLKTVNAEYRDAAGNQLTGVSDIITLDMTAPAGDMVIANDAIYTKALGVTLNNSVSGALQMRFSNDGSSWSIWEDYASTKAWSLTSGDGTKTVSAQYRDAAGNQLNLSDIITVDTTAPTGGMVINSDAAWSNVLGATLNNSVSDAAAMEMRFQDAGGGWSGWETYAPTKAWTLPTGDGLKTVNAEYRDAAGNVLSGVSDSITLDMMAPTGGMVINSDAAWSNVLGVTLNNSVSGATQMRFSNDGTSWSTWETYAATKAWTLLNGDGLKTVRAQYQDAAGNQLTGVSDAITLDMTPPSGSMIINSGAVWATTRNVTLNNSVSGASQMRFQDNGGSWGGWETYAATKAWTLPAGDGLKTVSAEYRDAAGNVLTDVSDTITLDTGMPIGTMAINGGAEYTNSAAVTITNNISDATQMRFQDGSGSWSGWETYAATRPLTLQPAADGLKTVQAEYRDAAGNVLALSDTITLNTVGPIGTFVIGGGVAVTNQRDVTLSNAVSGATQMCFRNDPLNDPTDSGWSPWVTYGATVSWPLSAGDGVKTVEAKFRDAAGNVLDLLGTITLDSTPPTHGSMSINGGSLATNSAIVALRLYCQDAAEMQFSNDGVAWSGWESYGSSKSWLLSAGDGLKTVRAQFKDTAGNLTSQAVTYTITLDTVAPTGSLTINGGVPYAKSSAVTLTSAVSPDCIEARFRNAGGSWSAWALYGASTLWTVGTGDGSKTVEAEFRDPAGNVGAAQAVINLDTKQPTPSAPKAATVRKGKIATLTYKVTDPVPCGATASVTIKIKTLKGKQVKAVTVASCRVNASAKYSFRCTFKKGTYRFYVYVTDAAGNVQSKVASNKLVVR
jgi:LmbE family N-acetylglucosaminyl deacetylase